MVGLVGRADEFARLAASVVAVPSLAVVAGEAGVGKTRLVSELLGQADGSGSWVAVGRCRPVREPFPLGPVLDVLRDGGAIPAGTALSPVVGALRPLLPEIADRLPLLPPPLGDRLDERHRVFRAVVELLAAPGPALVVLEDLHWADEQTGELLSYLLRDPPPRLALVLTYREDEVDPRLRAVAATAAEGVDRTHLELAPLDAEQTGALAAAILGEPRVSEEFAGHLWERTGGLPFAVEEVLALLRERGTLAWRDGRWQRHALAELDVPTGIRDPIRERLSRLSEAARAVAEAAAVLQVPVSAEVLTATARVPRAKTQQGLAEALEARLLIEPVSGPAGRAWDRASDEVGFRHLLAAQAVYEEIPLPRRQELHARAASALRALQPVPLGQVAHHLRLAGRTGEWVTAAEQAADQATALGDDAEAARQLEEVLREAPLATTHHGRLAVKLAKVATPRGGDLHGVLELLQQALDRSLPPAVRGELRFQLAILHDEDGADPRLRRQLLTDAVDDLADRPDVQVWTMVALACLFVPGSPPGEQRRWLSRALTVLPRVPDRHDQALLVGKVAMVQVGIGDPGWQGLTERLVAMTGSGPREVREVSAYWSVGEEASMAGHHELAGRILAAGWAGAAAEEHRSLKLSVRTAQVMLDYFRGAWDGVADQVELLIEELAYRPRRLTVVQAVAGCLALARGELASAHRLLSEVTGETDRRAMVDHLPIPAGALLRVELARGEVDRAVAAARRLVAALESVEFWTPAVRALAPVTEALVAAGLSGEAEQVVAGWAARLSGRDAPLAPAALAHARGLLAAATGRWADAASELRSAAERYDRLLCPYEAAQTRELAAAALASQGEPAGDELRSALAVYRRLGATGDAARAARAARELGVPVPAGYRHGRRGYGGGLTPQERAVAERVARQRTNREIAAELHLSIKTVEGHVSTVLRKLQVASRRSVAARLAPTGTDVSEPEPGQ